MQVPAVSTEAGTCGTGTRSVDLPLVAVVGAVVLWTGVLSWLAIRKHLAFHTGFDLAVFAQIVWATAQGQPFFTSLTAETTNFLGFHFSPILAVLAPLYRLWPDARLLLSLQAMILALPAIPLYSFARRRIGEAPALLLVGVYFFSPLLHYIALMNFHAIAFAVPLLMLAGIALLEYRYRAMMFWLALALLVKEEVALIAIGFGLYVLFIQRKWRFGLVLTAATVGWAVVQFTVLMPAWTETGGSYVFVRRYGAFGETPAEVLRTILTSPATVVRVVATGAKALFVWQLFAPLAGIPLLGMPATLLALPTVSYLILSDYALQVSIQHHYTAPLVPGLFLGAVLGLQRLQSWHRRVGRYAALAVAAATLIGTWWWGPLPGARRYEPATFATTPAAGEARALLKQIPADAAVVADWQYLPWLANRRWLDMVIRPPYHLLAPGRPPDYVLTQAPAPDAVSAPMYPWLITDHAGQPLRVHRFALQARTSAGLELWRYRGEEEDVILQRYDSPFERGLTLTGMGTPPEVPEQDDVLRTTTGTALPLWMAWKAREPLAEQVVFTVRLTNEAGEHVAQLDKEMGDGRFPTTLWHTWMTQPVVVGEFVIPIPASLPAGRYRLFVGAYERRSVQPLLRPDGSPWVRYETIVEVHSSLYENER